MGHQRKEKDLLLGIGEITSLGALESQLGLQLDTHITHHSHSMHQRLHPLLAAAPPSLAPLAARAAVETIRVCYCRRPRCTVPAMAQQGDVRICSAASIKQVYCISREAAYQ